MTVGLSACFSCPFTPNESRLCRGEVGLVVILAVVGFLDAKKLLILSKNDGCLACKTVGVGVRVTVTVTPGCVVSVLGFTAMRILPTAKITRTIKKTSPIKKAITDFKSDMSYSIAQEPPNGKRPMASIISGLSRV